MTPVAWIVTMLATTTMIYLVAAVAYHFADRPGMALCFIGYGLANVGLIIDAVK